MKLTRPKWRCSAVFSGGVDICLILAGLESRGVWNFGALPFFTGLARQATKQQDP